MVLCSGIATALCSGISAALCSGMSETVCNGMSTAFYSGMSTTLCSGMRADKRRLQAPAGAEDQISTSIRRRSHVQVYFSMRIEGMSTELKLRKRACREERRAL